MKKSTKNIASTVRELIAPTAESLGLILWDVEYVKEGTEWYLRITIDSDEGITIDDCEKMHRAIDPILDEADPIEGSYILEVSSPGLGRPLKKEKDFKRSLGEEVEIRLFRQVEHQKEWIGLLTAYDQQTVTIETEDGREMTFERSNLALIRLAFFF